MIKSHSTPAKGLFSEECALKLSIGEKDVKVKVYVSRASATADGGLNRGRMLRVKRQRRAHQVESLWMKGNG
jgi:hypothetical protein